ncbi:MULTISPECIES: hypothetical protein [unclassified Bartonella]|uniref:hypothetical protein n=1 Tax=unclassified Bartonella TaxID=2645622 RepID=UPI0035CF38E2
MNYFQRAFLKKIWAKQAAELSISYIPFNERDVLDALRQYALRPHKLLALNPKSEVVTVVNGVWAPHPPSNFLVLDTDRTIEEYTARIDQYAEGQEWVVMYYGLYAATPVLWDVEK